MAVTMDWFDQAWKDANLPVLQGILRRPTDVLSSSAMSQPNERNESVSTEVSTTGTSVPALQGPSAFDLDLSDVALPRLYVGQYSSQQVKDRLVEAGTAYLAQGKEDTEPVELEQPIRFHVFALRKGLSAEVNGELESYPAGSPDAPPDAYPTYNYVVGLPQTDQSWPVKFLLKKSGLSAARKINTTIVQKVQAGEPPHTAAFDLNFAFRQSTKGDYWVAVVNTAVADEEDLAKVDSLAALVPDESEGNGSDAAPAI